MRKITFLLAMVSTLVFQTQIGFSQKSRLTLTAKNELAVTRTSEIIVVALKEISKYLPASEGPKLQVTEMPSGRDLVSQTIDMDGDGVPDMLLFQSDFEAGESRSFALKAADKKIPSKDQFRAYGRFVRERYDDFAWENDRIAHRMYGAALETWEAEPLTSSAVDVWCKRVRRLVINDWYMMDNYHTDTGEGGDFYSAGRSRGCGGSGIWESGKLYVSRNFINSKVIANGPIRVVFELTYAPWDVNGRMVSEVKRVTLDAGQNLDHFESFYKAAPEGPMACGIGIKKNPGSMVQSDRKEGWLRTWEALQKGQAGNLGCGILLDPAALVDVAEADGNYLAIAQFLPGQPASYYAGFGWDRSGDFSSVNEWEAYLKQFAARLRSPLKIKIAPE